MDEALVPVVRSGPPPLAQLSAGENEHVVKDKALVLHTSGPLMTTCSAALALSAERMLGWMEIQDGTNAWVINMVETEIVIINPSCGLVSDLLPLDDDAIVWRKTDAASWIR